MAGQDYKRTISPGGAERINGNGETFLFCKFSDRDVTVDIAGKKAVMRSGSYQEFEPLTGPNAAVTIYNDDENNPAAVIFNMGTGTYDEKIIRGEVSVVPILRNSDGTAKPDTRYPLDIQIAPERLDTTSYARGDLVKKEAYLIPGATVLGKHDASRPCVFAGPGGYPVVSWYYNSRANGGWYQVDWDLNLIASGSENLIASTPIKYSSMSDVGWTPYNGFISVIDNDLYSADGPDDEKTHLYTSTISNLYTCCYVPDTDAILLMDFFGEKIEEIDAKTFERRRVLTIDEFQGQLRWDWKTKKLYLSGNNTYEMSYDTLTTIGGPIDVAAHFGTGFVPRGNNYFGTFGSGTDPVEIENVAFFDYVTKPEFVGIRPGCELAQALMIPESVPQITAAVEVNELFNGVEISGEIIKAALEYFFRREAPEDYLDHVYYADLGKDRAGVPIKPLSSGNETFDRAGITDNFTVLVPGRVALTVDNELAMGSPL